MLNNNWREIWKKKSIDHGVSLKLENLIELNGYDTGAGKVTSHDWLINIKALVEHMGISDGDTIYEVGCGAGAVAAGIKMLRNVTFDGSDYSPALIDIIKKALDEGDFECLEANKIRADKNYDHVICHGVFHYFDSEYAKVVFQKMLAKATKSVGVFEVPNAVFKVDSESVRRGALGAEEYEAKYKDLEHNYYHKIFFTEMVDLHAPSSNVTTADSFIPNSPQGKYRFNIIIQKL